MTDLKSALLEDALVKAVRWCMDNDVLVPLGVAHELAERGVVIEETGRTIYAVKAIGDITVTIAEYHDAITQAIVDYFTGDRRIQDARGDFKRAATNGLGDAFETGWLDGGQELPLDPEAVDWLAARQEQEFGFIDQLFVQAKELKQEKDFDYFAWATERADGYARTAKQVYDEGKIWAAKNKMLTFTGTDGSADHICQSIGGTCVRLMGQRHRASWWIAHGLIPGPGNSSYDCGGWNCQHFLQDDDGNRFTGAE